MTWRYDDWVARPWDVRLGDSLDVLADYADASVDAVVTDPPYGLSFMGLRWDYDVPSTTLWAECLRVLRPGGHLLAFAGTRTQHRMAVRIEDAGFEIRDMIAWVYGSGFPKSLDVGKAIDKQRTEDTPAIRTVCRAVRAAMDANHLKSHDLVSHFNGCHPRLIDHWAARDTDSQPSLPTPPQWTILADILHLHALDIEVARLNDRKGLPSDVYKSAKVLGEYKHTWMPGGFAGERFTVADHSIRQRSAAAQQWDGWGTALKPSLEPISVARKPLMGTVANNVLSHGVGALNIGACRVGDEARFNPSAGNNRSGVATNGNILSGTDPQASGRPAVGRWPANLLLEDSAEVRAAFPDAGGQQGALTGAEPSCKMGGADQHVYGTMDRRHASTPRADADTSAARFFAAFPPDGAAARLMYCPKVSRKERGASKHATMKPVALMRWLCRLVAPKGALILDPFSGSGSTGVAAAAEGMRFLGIEREPESYVTAWCRVAAAYGQQRAVADDARTGQDAPPQETSHG